MTQSRRIGLLGGTFDPVHIAHLHIAACVRHDLNLDEVRFIPAGAPPHKPGAPLTPGRDRLRMLEIATSAVEGFVVDPIDLETDGPSYTSELLARIRDQRPHDDLWFVIGGDSLAEFHTWHQPESILAHARLAVAARPGWDIEASLASSPVPGLAQRVDVFSSVPVDISASEIRNRLNSGRPVDWLLPEQVLNYARATDLYRHNSPDLR